MFQWKIMKTSTPPLPPLYSMLFFQSTYYCMLKANAQYESTLNWGRGGGELRLGIRCVFEKSVPTLLKMIIKFKEKMEWDETALITYILSLSLRWTFLIHDEIEWATSMANVNAILISISNGDAWNWILHGSHHGGYIQHKSVNPQQIRYTPNKWGCIQHKSLNRSCILYSFVLGICRVGVSLFFTRLSYY